MTLDDRYEHAHMDGFRPAYADTDTEYRIVVRLFSAGKHRPDIFSDQTIFAVAKTEDNEAELTRTFELVRSMCLYLNSGGHKDKLFLAVDRFVEKLPLFEAEGKLVLLIPPEGGFTMIRQREDGMYVRIVDGDEGFSEVLTEDEVKAYMGDVINSEGGIS